MKLPSREEWMNDKLIGAVMKAKSCSRPDAVAHLEERFSAMEALARSGARDEEIAKAGLPLTPEEFFALVYADALNGRQCAKSKRTDGNSPLKIALGAQCAPIKLSPYCPPMAFSPLFSHSPM